MNKIFVTSDGYHYEIDRIGVIAQLDHRPYKYDSAYSAIYDTDDYKRGNDSLQAMRLNFVTRAHGRAIRSIMDVGYGNGAFLEAVKESIPNRYGHDVTGVPLTSAYLMPELIKADVYTFWDVIEHYPDCSFLRDVQCETICVSLPYCHLFTEGVAWFDSWHHRKPNEHIRHFTPFTLAAFMQKYGWQFTDESDHEDIIRKPREIGKQNIISMAFKRK